MLNLHIVSNDPNFTSLIHSFPNTSLIILNFSAPWAEPCTQMNDVFQELSKLNPNLLFIQIDAENLPLTTEKYNIESVPTFVFLKKGHPIDRMSGANPMELKKKVDQYSKIAQDDIVEFASHIQNTSNTDSFSMAAEENATPSAIPPIIKKLIDTEPILVFMKGTPDKPQCGFSNQLVQLLNKYDAKFKSIDILSDESIRQGMKEYSNWPTFPQLYVQGEFIGGLDIVKELDESRDLKTMLATEGQELKAKLRQLINREPVMIFIKGTPNVPRCGFSNQLVSLLNQLRVKYGYFDILSDEEVRQGLKTYSDWPTYPQVYIEGELVGGLDIIKEMVRDNEFQPLVKNYIHS